jgi:hypothetical protein
MKNNMSPFTVIGMLILAAYIIINRFVVQLPDWIAFPVLAIAAALLVFSIIKSKNNK